MEPIPHSLLIREGPSSHTFSNPYTIASDKERGGGTQIRFGSATHTRPPKTKKGSCFGGCECCVIRQFPCNCSVCMHMYGTDTYIYKSPLLLHIATHFFYSLPPLIERERERERENSKSEVAFYLAHPPPMGAPPPRSLQPRMLLPVVGLPLPGVDRYDRPPCR